MGAKRWARGGGAAVGGTSTLACTCSEYKRRHRYWYRGGQQVRIQCRFGGGLVQVETSGRGKKKRRGRVESSGLFFLVPQLAQAGSVSASRGRTLGLRERERERVGRSSGLWMVRYVESCLCRRGVKSGLVLVLVLVRWRDGKRWKTDGRQVGFKGGESSCG